MTRWIGLILSGYQRPRLVLTPQWWLPGNRLSPQRIVVAQTPHGVNTDPSGCADIFALTLSSNSRHKLHNPSSLGKSKRLSQLGPIVRPHSSEAEGHGLTYSSHWPDCNWCSSDRQALFIGPTLDDDFVQTFKPSSSEEESFLAMNVDDEDAVDSRNVNKLNAPVRAGLNVQLTGTRTMAYPPTSPPISATPTGFGTKTTSPPQAANKSSKSSKSSQDCTPSPTTSMAPSASKLQFPWSDHSVSG